jgi:protein-S-isoprenylcysteine O-methyltransferase Ste14
VLRRAPGPRLPRGAGSAGVALQAGGLALRAWSMHTLGAYYSRTLRSATGQGVVDTGPYRLVRHPGYAAYSRRTKKIIPFAW